MAVAAMAPMVLKPHAIRSAAAVAGFNLLVALIGLAWLPEARSWWIGSALITPGLWGFFEIKGRILRLVWGPGERLETLRRGFGVVATGAGVAAAAFSLYLLGDALLDWDSAPEDTLRRYILAVVGIFYLWAGNGMAKMVDSHANPRIEIEHQRMRRFIGWFVVIAGLAALAAALLVPDAQLEALTRFGTLPLCALIIARRLYGRVRIMLAE